jgi:hypothetical protein
MPEFRCCGLISGFAALAALLGGCSVPSLPSLFGSSPPPAAADSNASVVFTPPANFECPIVAIRQGAGALSLSADPAAPTALNLRYQLALGDTARECHLAGPMVTMKVGVQGRVIRGPAGGPGQLEVPIRFAVVQEGVEPKVITTSFQRVPVTIPPDDPNVSFSYVENRLAFPFPRGGAIDSYVVYIGFDPVEAEQMDKSKKKPARKPARTGRANTAQAPAR